MSLELKNQVFLPMVMFFDFFSRFVYPVYGRVFKGNLFLCSRYEPKSVQYVNIEFH
jgi:hypothetical protein